MHRGISYDIYHGVHSTYWWFFLDFWLMKLWMNSESCQPSSESLLSIIVAVCSWLSIGFHSLWPGLLLLLFLSMTLVSFSSAYLLGEVVDRLSSIHHWRQSWAVSVSRNTSGTFKFGVSQPRSETSRFRLCDEQVPLPMRLWYRKRFETAPSDPDFSTIAARIYGSIEWNRLESTPICVGSLLFHFQPSVSITTIDRSLPSHNNGSIMVILPDSIPLFAID